MCRFPASVNIRWNNPCQPLVSKAEREFSQGLLSKAPRGERWYCIMSSNGSQGYYSGSANLTRLTFALFSLFGMHLPRGAGRERKTYLWLSLQYVFLTHENSNSSDWRSLHTFLHSLCPFTSQSFHLLQFLLFKLWYYHISLFRERQNNSQACTVSLYGQKELF